MQPEPFGPYILARKIAVGGTAEIFLARREGADGFARHIAIKRILPHLAGETEFVRLLLDEARLAAHLHHGHIVQIHDVGEIDGQAYIAMEYLPGTDVGRIMRTAQKRARRVVVADPDDARRAALIRYIAALPRRLEVVPAADRIELDRRSAEGSIDLAVVAAPFAEAVDGLVSRHPELLRAIVSGEPVMRPNAAVLLAGGHDSPAEITALVDGCLRAPLPLDIAIQIVRAVADGLDHAHTAVDYADEPLAIVHRDVNPSNVLVSTSGTVKLVDFGIARAASSPEGRRRGFVGTYHYMSPEQTEGDPVDARSDLFSLGTLIHELVTGEHPFRAGDMFSTMRAVREDTPPPLDSRVPGVPAALMEIARRAGQKDREARYPSAEAMLTDIEEVARRSGLNMSPKRLAGFVRVVFGAEVKQFGVTTLSLPAIRLDADGKPVQVAPAARDSIRSLPPEAYTRPDPPVVADELPPVVAAPIAARSSIVAPLGEPPPIVAPPTRDDSPTLDSIAALEQPLTLGSLLAIADAPSAEPPTVDELPPMPALLPMPELPLSEAPPFAEPPTVDEAPPVAALPLPELPLPELPLPELPLPGFPLPESPLPDLTLPEPPPPEPPLSEPPALHEPPGPSESDEEEDGPTQVAPPSPELLAALAARAREPARPPVGRAPIARASINRTLTGRAPLDPAPLDPAPLNPTPRHRVLTFDDPARPAPASELPLYPAASTPPPPPRAPVSDRLSDPLSDRLSDPLSDPPSAPPFPADPPPDRARRDRDRAAPEDRPSLHNLPPPPEPTLARGDGAARVLLVAVLIALLTLVGLYVWWRSNTEPERRSATDAPAPACQMA